MRTENVIDSLIWFINVLLAFAIILFAFLFILFPKPERLQSRYAAELNLEETEERPADLRLTADHYRPCWKRLSQPEAPQGPKGPTVDLNKTYKVTALKVDLKNPAKWVAWLLNRVSQTENPDGYREGDALDSGYRIVEITEKYLVAERAVPGGQAEQQRLEYYVGDEPGAPDGRGTGGNLDEILARAKRSSNDPNRWTVSPEERQWVLDHQEELMGEIQYRPYVPEGGQMQGVILAEIPTDSIAAKRGLQNGDVISSVNGIALTSSEAAESLLANESVRGANTVTIVVLRQGRTVTMQFDVGSR